MGGGKFCSSGFCAARHSNLARDPSWTYNCSKVLFESESPSYIWKMWYKIKISKTYLTNQYVSSNMGILAFVMVINYIRYLKKNSYNHVFCISVSLTLTRACIISMFSIFSQNITFWNKVLLKVVLHSPCNYDIFDRIVQTYRSSARIVIKEIYHKMHLF